MSPINTGLNGLTPLMLQSVQLDSPASWITAVSAMAVELICANKPMSNHANYCPFPQWPAMSWIIPLLRCLRMTEVIYKLQTRVMSITLNSL